MLTKELQIDAEGNAGSSRVQTKWNWVYYALALFDIVTICASLYINHQLTVEFAKAVEVNEFWSDRQEDLGELGRLAVALNTPGNDVFLTGDIPEERGRFQDALVALKSEMEKSRAIFEEIEHEGTRVRSLKIFAWQSNQFPQEEIP